ncbi:hypothetical protein BS50DRAFT_584407 [Corynespora cassiicola Philippines]|uniref:Uncharacterized protein n=1 Tax=Corynespora cassiicola Philippines TaxID=1448308 RepID=A0A2T2NZY4_CORCC|nr:hypothetical protein BS50DRAFT_584407 [Corynespora cassiicola Philippines]
MRPSLNLKYPLYLLHPLTYPQTTPASHNSPTQVDTHKTSYNSHPDLRTNSTGGAGLDEELGGGGGAAEEDDDDEGTGGRVDVDLTVELGGGADEDTGGPPPPPHTPNAALHPPPQYASEAPQKYHSEQQFPNGEPPHVVTLPHWPLVDTMSVPEGSGGATVDEGGLAVDDGTGVLEDGDGVGVGVGSGSGSLPQRPYCGWHPTISPQCSNASPHQPYEEQHCVPGHLWPPYSAPQRPAWRGSRRCRKREIKFGVVFIVEFRGARCGERSMGRASASCLDPKKELAEAEEPQELNAPAKAREVQCMLVLQMSDSECSSWTVGAPRY